MKSESRVKGYKPGTEDWKAEYNMLLDDGVTCNDCVFVKKCCSIFGQTPYVNEGKCQFYPNRFVKNIKEGVIMTGIERIAAERKRQIEGEGRTAADDDFWVGEQLAQSAACYAIPEKLRKYRFSLTITLRQLLWPFFTRPWKPTPDNRIRELEKAGALMAAEIDRLQRMEEKEESNGENNI